MRVLPSAHPSSLRMASVLSTFSTLYRPFCQRCGTAWSIPCRVARRRSRSCPLGTLTPHLPSFSPFSCLLLCCCGFRKLTLSVVMLGGACRLGRWRRISVLLELWVSDGTRTRVRVLSSSRIHTHTHAQTHGERTHRHFSFHQARKYLHSLKLPCLCWMQVFQWRVLRKCVQQRRWRHVRNVLWRLQWRR